MELIGISQPQSQHPVIPPTRRFVGLVMVMALCGVFGHLVWGQTQPVVTTRAAGVSAVPYFVNLKINPQPLNQVLFEPVQRPGIILLVTDTLRPDHLGAYGYGHDTSPFIDSLANNGVTFLNHVSNSTWTKTSLASLMTGLLPSRHKVLEVNTKLAPSYVTLAEAFKQAGYKTGAVVANYIAGRRYGLVQGFDFVAEPQSHFDGKPPHAGQVLAQAARWIQGVGDAPFFLMVLLFDAHDPYFPPQNLRTRFCPDCGTNLITSPEREYRKSPPSPKQVADMKSLYDGEIRFIDDQLRSFYNVLTKLGVLSRTTFALVSDHGEAFGEHQVFEHAFHTWDEVIRTPLILQGAGVKSRGQVVAPSQLADLYPTLLRLGGVIPPSGLQGVSLVSREGEVGLRASRMLVTEVEMYGVRRITIRGDGLKLVQHQPLNKETFLKFYKDLHYYPSVTVEGTRREFYDLMVDPFEAHDLYTKEPARAADLVKALETYLQTGGLESIEESTTSLPELMEDLKSLGYTQ